MEEGFKGFYKGFIWSFFSQTISKSMFFTIYGNSKDYFMKKHGKIDDIHIFCSSLSSGAITSFVTSPLWVVKTRLMLNREAGKSVFF